jgi:two-component system OmpR family response regulator
VQLAKSKKILIVEDEPDILNLLGEAFRYYGFEVQLELDTMPAWNKFHDNSKDYDAILLDFKIGNRDSGNLYKKLKEEDIGAKIFVFTGLNFDTNDFRVKVCPSFEDQYLITKPVRMNSLVERVKSVLG